MQFEGKKGAGVGRRLGNSVFILGAMAILLAHIAFQFVYYIGCNYVRFFIFRFDLDMGQSFLLKNFDV